MRRTRGNVLITALFISIFLFFMCAALVSMNRQDVFYTLTNNQRLQAEAAARAGFNYVVQVMKTVPQWENQASSFHGSMGSDATWSATVATTADAKGLPYLKQVTVEGKQGAVSETVSEVLEEFKVAATVSQSQNALMFSYVYPAAGQASMPPTIAMLNSTFQWHVLGPAPLQNPIGGGAPYLVGSGGPLFTQTGALPTPTPPQIYDWRPTSDAHNILIPGDQQGIAVTGTDQDEHIAYLTFNQNQPTWNAIPVPPDTLGAYRGSLIGGQPNGQPQTQTVSTATETVTFYSSLFQGPVKDWYGLRGPGMAANGSTVICHAVHYFYLGEQFQNHVSVVRGKIVSNPYHAPAQTLQMPAVLAYDVGSQTWTVVVDCMQFPNGHQQAPTQYSGPSPSLYSLGAPGGTPYAYATDGRSILKGQKNAWMLETMVPTPVSLAILGNTSLMLHEANGASDDGLPQVTINGVTPEGSLSFETSPTLGSLYQASASGGSPWQPRVLRPQLTVHLSMLSDLGAAGPAFTVGDRGANCVAEFGSELWSFVRVRRHWIFDSSAHYATPFDAFTPIGSPGSDWNLVDTLALAHWDGQGWQLWPGGITPQIQVAGPNAAAPYPLTVDGTSSTLDVQHLATAVYAGSTPDLRRYAPVPGQP
ncbi:MAG TPA: hypothetical protein VGO93_23880 [Candidatus Xenobia bacterium]|jgi:hypothetical protein